MDKTCRHVPAEGTASASRQLGNAAAQPLAHQVNGQDIGPQAETSDDVAVRGRTEETDASADHQGADVAGGETSLLQCTLSCVGAERRSLGKDCRVSGLMRKTSFKESMARQRELIPLSFVSAVSAIMCDRRSRFCNHAEAWKASQHPAFV